MEGPRPAKKEEIEELTDLLDQVFWPGQKGRSRDVFPHLDTENEEDIQNAIIIKEDGRIASHVVIVPLEIFVDGSVLKTGAIAAVATKEEYRNRGFVSAILKHCVLKMQDEGYDLSLLWGFRDRYGRFGWELGGKEHVYNLTPRSLPFLNSNAAEIRPHKEALSDLEQIMEIHDREPLRVIRSKRRYKFLLNFPTGEVWLNQTNEDFSYVAIRGEGKKRVVAEFGGEKEPFSALLKYIIQKLELEELLVPAPPRNSKLTSLLTEASLSWEIRPLGMIKIMDLRKSLEKLKGSMKANLKRYGKGREGKITLEVPDLNQRVTLEIDQDIHLSDREVPSKIELNQREMVRLLFGLDYPSKIFGLENEVYLLLDRIFPLDPYVWNLDQI